MFFSVTVGQLIMLSLAFEGSIDLWLVDSTEKHTAASRHSCVSLSTPSSVETLNHLYLIDLIKLKMICTSTRKGNYV